MQNINQIIIKIFSKLVGEDQFGNRYYISKKLDYLGRAKRQVVYNGILEATKVPPIWHAWLHYMSDDSDYKNRNFDWQCDYVPNLTGTKYAHQLKSNKRPYNKWKPL